MKLNLKEMTPLEREVYNSIRILKQLGIWGKVSLAEKEMLFSSENDVQVGNHMCCFRNKYM